jgi:UDP-2,4-diacetamido-2,4,6-trideoxy-beta-L-altropyranose hydrolase
MGTQEKRLIIRADGNTRIGTGHVMRCLALAQAWQERGGSVSFALAQHTPALLERLTAEECLVYTLHCEPGSSSDAAQTLALAQQIGATWIVIDGYHFSAAYQQAIKAAGVSLLVIDDYGHAEHYYADLVLNQNVSASESLYTSREPYTRLLLGTRYTLLRREFWAYRGWKREVPDVARKILVTMGGGDPDNVTLKVIHALNQVAQEPFEAVVVVGGSNPHIEALQEAVDDKPHINLAQDVANMTEHMTWADLAIAAGGSTCWELALFGLPMLLIPIADNQLPIANKLGELGIALVVGWYADVSSDTLALAINRLIQEQETRLRMSHAGQALVDGEGGERVVEEMAIRLGIAV